MLDRQLTWFLAYIKMYGSHPKAHVSQGEKAEGQHLVSTYPTPLWTDNGCIDSFTHSANPS